MRGLEISPRGPVLIPDGQNLVFFTFPIGSSIFKLVSNSNFKLVSIGGEHFSGYSIKNPSEFQRNKVFQNAPGKCFFPFRGEFETDLKLA